MVPPRGTCPCLVSPGLGVPRKRCGAAAGFGTPGLRRGPQEASGPSCSDSLAGEEEGGWRNAALRDV